MEICTEMLYWQGYIRYGEALIVLQEPLLALRAYSKGLREVPYEGAQRLVRLFLSLLCELLSLIASDTETKTLCGEL